jgi:hypothetical protein
MHSISWGTALLNAAIGSSAVRFIGCSISVFIVLVLGRVFMLIGFWFHGFA